MQGTEKIDLAVEATEISKKLFEKSNVNFLKKK